MMTATTDVQAQLDAIYRSRGVLTPHDVVEEATPEDHPLHVMFEWDDAVAGHQHRLEQARRMIRTVRVSYHVGGEERSIRAYHALRDVDGGNRYESVEKIAEDPMSTQLLLRNMEREFKAMIRRYERFDEFWRLIRDAAA